MGVGHDHSRRDFLRGLGSAAALGAGARLLDAEERPLPARSRVVVARDPQLRNGGSGVDPQRLRALLDRAMSSLFFAHDRPRPVSTGSASDWRRIARPGQCVGIKVNTLGGRGISTSVALVEAICERLQQAGIRPADIVVWDRATWELERAGFHTAMGGDRVQCYGTDRVDYAPELSEWGSVGSRISKILLRSDVLINVPVLKDHDGAGVTMALKNMYGVIHNPNKFHPNGCNPYVADVNMLPEIRQRLRLTVCDATTAMYEGGPGFKPQFSWPCNSLLVSEDPVALDYTGWQMIEHKRAEKGLKPLEAEGRAPHYIATAADSHHRLGHNDPARIVLVEA